MLEMDILDLFFISLPFADKYSIVITEICIFGDNIKPSFGWNIGTNKLGFWLESSNSDTAYFFGTLHPGQLWTVNFKIS